MPATAGRADERERHVQDLARELAQAEREEVGAFHLGWWTDRMLAWALAHPQFKTQLFRFVDVFCACHDDTDVHSHLREYFDGVPVPRALELGIEMAEHVPLGEAVSAAVARRNISRIARQFIAGAGPQRARHTLRRLWRQGKAATVDLLGERIVTESEADGYAARLGELLDVLLTETINWPEMPQLERDPWGPLPRVHLSVKPTALTPRFDPLRAREGLEAAMARLRPVLERARQDGALVSLDAEHDEVKDLTLELLRHIGAELPDAALGCVIQAYRRDAYADLRDLVVWSADTLRTPLQVRLVKGAYWDRETVIAAAEGWPSPVFATRAETDANFERCTRLLIDHAGAVRPAIASHNLRSLAYAIVYARERGLGDDAYELQLLYGMAEPVHRALVRQRLRVRVYVPVGELVPGMAYLVRRLLENTANESFVRSRFVEGRALDELVTPPGVDERDLPEDRPAELELSVRAATDPDAPGAFLNEPHAELRRPEPRRVLVAAVGRVAASGLGFEAPVVIGGERVATDRRLTSVDPGDPARVVCRSGCAGTAEADDALAVARRAWPSWAEKPWRERAAVLFRAAALLRARRAELAALEVFEAGKPIAEADADVCEAIDFCEYYGREALRLASGATVQQAPGEVNDYRYIPRGIGVVISPWNFPLAIPAGMVTAALVTGNAVLFKPAEQTPGIASRLVDVLHAAGVPPGVLAFLPGVGEEVGAYLVEHPEVAFVSFTGSKAVGLQIVERAARHHPAKRHVTHVVAEMGGKNAIVVDSDADLDVAVPAIVHSAFTYAGQKCSAASRVVAVGPVLDHLIERLTGATMVVSVGHPAKLATTCGPLIDADALARVSSYGDVAATEGRILVARDDVPARGYYVGPTVVLVNDARARIATEEIFGPILTVLSADDFDHALALANDTEYALTGGLFSRSPTHIQEATRRFKAGNLYVNRAITGALVGRQPFGGYGLSGVGAKAGGPDTLRQYVNARSVTENTMRQGFVPSEEIPS